MSRDPCSANSQWWSWLVSTAEPCPWPFLFISMLKLCFPRILISHWFGLASNTRETAARIVLVDDIFRAMTHQVQYMRPFTYLASLHILHACGESIAEVGHLELIFTSCPYLSFLRKKFMVQGEDKLKGSAQANLERNRQSRLNEKIDRFRSGGKHSWTGGEHSPVRAHTSTRSRSWACRNHKTLTNLWQSKGLWRWVLLLNARTFSLPSLLWLGLGATACVKGMLPACSCVCDRSDKRRQGTKKSEFDKEKTNRRANSTVNGCLVADTLSFLSLEVRSCDIVHVTADAVKQMFTCNRPCTDRKCRRQRSNNECLFNIGVAPPVSSTQWTGAAVQCREISPD